MRLLLDTGLLNARTKQASLFPGLSCDGIYFTKREKQTLYYLIRGKSAKNIAHILGRSPRTREHQISNMKLKSNCYSKSELIYKVMSFVLRDKEIF